MQRFYSVLINWAAILSCELFKKINSSQLNIKIPLESLKAKKSDFQVTSLHYLVLTPWTTMLHCKLWVSDVSLSSEMKFQLQLPFLIMQPEQEL